MKTLLIIVVSCLAVAPVAAEETKKPVPRTPAHTPEWTNPTQGDPGVQSTMDELQKIVVLCAKDHESAEFKRAWMAYVRKHKLEGADLEKAKRKVVNGAFQHRQQFGQAKGDRKDMIEWKKGARQSMDATTMTIIDNMRDKR